MNGRNERLSACIITKNEAARLPDCLASLAWCDEILVVDSHSTDATRAVAESHGARVIEREWPGFAEQKEFAVRAAQHDWVLCIDADERVLPALRDEIIGLRESGFGGAAGWEMPRLTQYLGASIRHGTWYPDRQLRLFDRRRGRFAANPLYPLHERVHVDGPVRRLRGDLLHVPYRTISDHLRTIDRYTTIMAEGLHRHGRHAGVFDLTLRPAAELLRFYVLKGAVLDGWRGLLLALLHAHYVQMKYLKLYARQRADAP